MPIISKPFVFERTIQTVDPVTGDIVEQKIESVEPKVELKLVDHIGLKPTAVSSQSVQDDCDCLVTKEEMIETVIAAIKATKDVPTSIPEENFFQQFIIRFVLFAD